MDIHNLTCYCTYYWNALNCIGFLEGVLLWSRLSNNKVCVEQNLHEYYNTENYMIQIINETRTIQIYNCCFLIVDEIKWNNDIVDFFVEFFSSTKYEPFQFLYHYKFYYLVQVYPNPFLAHVETNAGPVWLNTALSHSA